MYIVYIYIYIHSMRIYIYIHILYMYICVYLHVYHTYIYIYTCITRSRGLMAPDLVYVGTPEDLNDLVLSPDICIAIVINNNYYYHHHHCYH